MTGTIVSRGAAPQPQRGRNASASRDTTPPVDLIGELDALAEMAGEARRRLAAGLSLNGSSALAKIQDRASDAARWARKAAA